MKVLPINRVMQDDEGIAQIRRATNIGRTEHRVSTQDRTSRNRHFGGVLWMTGLSGSGKSTLAVEAETQLFERGYQVFVLDGDNLRQGLNADLGFSAQDRTENIRRAGEVAAIMSEAGMLVIAAFISPYKFDRERARLAARAHFHEIHIRADLATCESRDPKGLYKKARAGQIREFTGIDAPYEAPEAADLVVDTVSKGIEVCVSDIVNFVERRLRTPA